MSTSYNQLRQSQGSKLSNLNSSTGSNEKIGSEIVVPSLAANGNRKSVGSMNLKSSQSDKMNSTMVKHSTSDLLQAYTDGDLKHESSGQLESSKTIEAANNNNNQEKKKSLQELDSILGDFSKKINLASTEKEYKGICNKCQQPIVGKLEGVQTADGVFHSKCFTCEGCQKDIPSSTSYYVHPVQGKPYHIDCYEKTYLEECQGCHKRITEGRILHATGSDNLKRSFHTDCFRCGLSVRDRTADAQPASPANEQPAATDGDIDDRPRGCQAPLQLDQNEGVEAIHTKYFIQNDLVYCQECYDLHFLPQCGECGERIKNLDANGKIRFYTHEGKPYCIECYEMSFVPECGRCHTRIKKLNEYDIDKFVVVSGDKYHKSCFNCYDCGQSFDQLKAYMWKNKQFYCREHYDKVAAAAVS